MLSLVALLFATQAMNAQTSRKRNAAGQSEQVNKIEAKQDAEKNAKRMELEKRKKLKSADRVSRKKGTAKANKGKAKARKSEAKARNKQRVKANKKANVKSRKAKANKGSATSAKKHKPRLRNSGM